MKKTKILVVLAILALTLVSMTACFNLSDVKGINFTKAPKANYSLNESAAASEFEVAVEFADGSTSKLALDSDLLTVEGLVNGKLDTATAGMKSLKITYQGVSITVQYMVGTSASTELWVAADNGDGADGAALLYTLTHDDNVELTKDYDLSGKQWPAIELTSELTLDGKGHTITGMTLTTEAAIGNDGTNTAVGGGLFGNVTAALTVSNLKFDKATIEYTDINEANNGKNYGCVVGTTSATAALTVSNVSVTNAYMKGNGRIGGIAGQTNKTVDISNCNVSGVFVGFNPISVATADGEADKIGGIIGQVQHSARITGCTVNVTINGTRDLGGIAGYVSQANAHTLTAVAVTITNNTVVDGSVITANVTGGMLPSKGSRNVGGIIGTLAAATVTVTGNTVQDSVVIAKNSLYDDSNANYFIGGFRSDLVFKFVNSEIEYSKNDATIAAANEYLEANNTCPSED